MVVQHNLAAANAGRMLGITAVSIAKTTEKLSSGFRVNRAADDAACLSISEKMRRQIRGLTQASLNVQDGISMVQTADGALAEVSDMLQRMNELTIKAANGTMTFDDRGYIQAEVEQLKSEIDRIGATTKFNEKSLFTGLDTNPYIHSDALKTTCNTALSSALSSLSLSETPTFTENEDGTYNLSIGKSGNLGKTINDGGSIKTISNVTRRIELARNDMKCLYDSSGKLVYENIQYKYYGSSATVKDEDKHLSDEQNMEFILKLSEENSIDELVNSHKYYAYTPVTDTLVKTPDVSYGSKVGGHTLWAKSGIDSNGHSYFEIRKTADPDTYYKTENGENLRFTHLGNNHWVTNATLYDSSGFKWEAGDEFINTLMHDNRNYVYYNSGADLFAIMGQYGYNYDGKHLLYTDATLTYVTADAFKYVDVPNTITKDDAKALIDSKISDALAGTSFKDADGNELDYRVISKSGGNYNISFFAKGTNPQSDSNSKLIDIQAGSEGSDASKIKIGFEKIDSRSLAIDSVDVTTQNTASESIDPISSAIQSISKMRSKYGAYQNRMEHAIRNLDNVVENTTVAESAIRDTDMSSEMVEFAKKQILMQVGQTMLAQANMNNQSVLALL